MNNHTIHQYHCGNCPDGIVNIKVSVKGDTKSVDIKKCTSCKKQYFYRELFDHKEVPLKKIEQIDWISVKDNLPNIPKNDVQYYKVKFSDGSEDEKPFRNKPSKNILGFMAEKEVTHWKDIN